MQEQRTKRALRLHIAVVGQAAQYYTDLPRKKRFSQDFGVAESGSSFLAGFGQFGPAVRSHWGSVFSETVSPRERLLPRIRNILQQVQRLGKRNVPSRVGFTMSGLVYASAPFACHSTLCIDKNSER